MFNKKSGGDSAATTSTIIGRDCTITGGTLSGQGSLRIDGHLIGTVDIEGQLILGETGSIEGDIRARSALLAGRAVSGRVICAESLHIVSTGSLHGDITVGALVVDEEAVFVGNCKMDNGRNEETLSTKQVHTLRSRNYEVVQEELESAKTAKA